MSIVQLRRALLAAIFISAPMLAQDVTGTVQGAVTDPGGGRVAGVKVSIW